MTVRSDAEIIERLSWVVSHHIPAGPDDRGLTCDERGCPICNGGADNPDEEARGWFEAWAHPDIDPEYGAMYAASLPFDPDDDDDWADWVAERDAELGV